MRVIREQSPRFRWKKRIESLEFSDAPPDENFLARVALFRWNFYLNCNQVPQLCGKAS
jgi:hypothetical protein